MGQAVSNIRFPCREAVGTYFRLAKARQPFHLRLVYVLSLFSLAETGGVARRSWGRGMNVSPLVATGTREGD